MKKPGKTMDHTVPQMYLSRFGVPAASGYLISAALVNNLEKPFQTTTRHVGAEQGFYWGTTPDGVAHHDMEDLLTVIEGNAAHAFRAILDQSDDVEADALPWPWPPDRLSRAQLAWWIAVQILRTTRQRERLIALDDPALVRPELGLSKANAHLEYIAKMAEPLAKSIYARPWGIGFSDACLMTADVPVLVLNGQDHDDQSAAIDYWDVYLPLDPHRCLFLPGKAHRERAGISGDHRFKLHPGLGIALNQAMFDTAMKHVVFHPDHYPRRHISSSGRMSRPGEKTEHGDPRYLINYGLVPSGHGIQRKWLFTHPPATNGLPTGQGEVPDEMVLDELLAQMEKESHDFHDAAEERGRSRMRASD